MSNKFIWCMGLALWLLFTFWYTNTGGALTTDEIDHYVELMSTSDGVEGDPARLRAFLERDTGGQFIMVNIIDLNENPPLVPGAAPGEGADKLMSRYMEFMFPALLARGCHPAFMGLSIGPAVDLVGLPGAYEWDQAVLMRYRSVRDLLEVVTNPAFAGSHVFKVAALDKTVAFPVTPILYLSDPRFLLALILFNICAAIKLIFLNKRS